MRPVWRSIGGVVVAAGLVAVGCAASGPVGTVVTVSGTGCRHVAIASVPDNGRELQGAQPGTRTRRTPCRCSCTSTRVSISVTASRSKRCATPRPVWKSSTTCASCSRWERRA